MTNKMVMPKPQQEQLRTRFLFQEFQDDYSTLLERNL